MMFDDTATQIAEREVKAIGRLRVWDALPDWSGCSVAILASGPSMNADVAARIQRWQRGALGRYALVINTTYRLAPWADMIYACDGPWWEVHHAEVKERCRTPELWSQDRQARDRFGVKWISSTRSTGLAVRAGVINQGSNGGYQAINIAWQAGASRAFLFGYDMRIVDGKDHWHGDHPGVLKRAMPFAGWIPQFEALASGCAEHGMDVLNCTPGSALTAFRRQAPEDALS